MMSKALASVIKAFTDREVGGFEKYGTTVDRTDFTAMQWLQNLQEELMDAVMYIEALKQHAQEDQS